MAVHKHWGWLLSETCDKKILSSLPLSFLTLFISCKISNSTEFHLSQRHDISCFKNWLEKEKKIIWTRETLFTLKSVSYCPLFFDTTLLFFLLFMQVTTPLRRQTDKQTCTHPFVNHQHGQVNLYGSPFKVKKKNKSTLENLLGPCYITSQLALWKMVKEEKTKALTKHCHLMIREMHSFFCSFLQYFLPHSYPFCNKWRLQPDLRQGIYEVSMKLYVWYLFVSIMFIFCSFGIWL